MRRYHRRPKPRLTAAEKDAARERERKLREQQDVAKLRATYGPSGKPAPVTVKKAGEEQVVEPTVFATSLHGVNFTNRLAIEAGYSNYASYLHSEHWRKLRNQAVRRDRHRCCQCSSREQLLVHHKTYVRFGNERLGDLQTLCAACHEQRHNYFLRRNRQQYRRRRWSIK
jgi:5-methylcytosine-specific restriction endonuclease McrA